MTQYISLSEMFLSAFVFCCCFFFSFSFRKFDNSHLLYLNTMNRRQMVGCKMEKKKNVDLGGNLPKGGKIPALRVQ